MSFFLEILDTKRAIYSGEANKLVMPSLVGQITVLPDHMPIVAPIELGEIVVNTPQKNFSLTIGKGIFSFKDNKATLLIEDARYSDEISEEEAQAAKTKALEIIEKGVTGADLDAAMATVRRSLVDLKTARKRRAPRL